MYPPLFRLMTLLAALLLGAAAQAQLGGSGHIRPSLVAETASPRVGGAVTLAFVMRTERGWHGYWRNPGDAGVAPRVAWTLPKGLAAGPLLYPVPQRLTVAELVNFVYEGDHALLAQVTIPAGLATGTRLPVTASLDYLVCSATLCVPEHAVLSIVLTVGDGAVTPADRARFDGWRARLPRPLASASHLELKGGALRVAIPLPRAIDAGGAYLFPLASDMIDLAAPQRLRRAGDALVVELPLRAGTVAPPRFEGVLRLRDGTGLAIAARPGAVPAGVPLVPREGDGGAADEGVGLLAALGGALLGGLLLNVMPCVFPILSLKALGLARAGDERAARREALAYTAGAVLGCAALGAVLLLLRQAGLAAGWAFQLQDPRVILLLLLLVVAIALNLAGLFELPVLAGGVGMAKDGAAGAFGTGALAAFVATPCAGPFLATALGAALVLPAGAALAVFAGLGLGLALPFLLVGLVPAARRLLPRPGAWMATFRRVLALPMLATALGLAWVLGRQAGVAGMTFGLALALVLAIALWWVGLRQGGSGERVAVPALLALASVPAALLLPLPSSAMTIRPDGGDVAFSEARLAALRGEGRPVFVYFTADWCLTCKVNEAAAIDRAEVRRTFAARNVAVLAADWTRADPTITRVLASHGRSAVPLYLFYPAGGGAPRVLPQLLTPALLEAQAG